MFIYEFWIETFPFLSECGEIVPIFLSIATVIALIRIVLFAPLFMLGMVNKI